MTDEQERMRQAVWSVYYKARGLRRSVLPPSVRPMRAEGALDILLEHKDENRGARRRRALLEAGAGNLHQREREGVATRVGKLAGRLNVNHRVLDDVGTPKADVAADRLITDATVQSEVQKYVAANGTDYNTIYEVFLPSSSRTVSRWRRYPT